MKLVFPTLWAQLPRVNYCIFVEKARIIELNVVPLN